MLSISLVFGGCTTFFRRGRKQTSAACHVAVFSNAPELFCALCLVQFFLMYPDLSQGLIVLVQTQSDTLFLVLFEIQSGEDSACNSDEDFLQ